MKKVLLIVLSISAISTFAHEDKVSFAFYDGIFITGYVDNGAFLNFTGTNINTKNQN